MRKDPTYLVWHIQGPTPSSTERIEQTLRETGSLDYVEQRVRQGGGTCKVMHYRLGDYFAQIRLLEDSRDYSGCLRLLFQRLPTADRYWKDLMVHLLDRIRQAAGDIVINLAYQGEVFPHEAQV
jgi:cell division FtsZ-interacting protein ZapD